MLPTPELPQPPATAETSEGACTSAIKLASDGSEAGLAIRELRLHRDNLHITWNSFSVSTTGLLDESMAALRNVPPVTDLITATASASVRNNGVRRFFQPFLLDRDGDGGLYFGQQLNAAGDGSPSAVNDSNWNAGADPHWSRDGTKVAYYQWLAVAINTPMAAPHAS